LAPVKLHRSPAGGARLLVSDRMWSRRRRSGGAGRGRSTAACVATAALASLALLSLRERAGKCPALAAMLNGARSAPPPQQPPDRHPTGGQETPAAAAPTRAPAAPRRCTRQRQPVVCRAPVHAAAVHCARRGAHRTARAARGVPDVQPRAVRVEGAGAAARGGGQQSAHDAVARTARHAGTQALAIHTPLPSTLTGAVHHARPRHLGRCSIAAATGSPLTFPGSPLRTPLRWFCRLGGVRKGRVDSRGRPPTTRLCSSAHRSVHHDVF
jgi:hypothetical protein